MSDLILYSRAGCHLCEQAEELLARGGVEFQRVEITGNDELERLYGWDVPVLARGGEVLAKGVFSRARLARLGLTSA